MKFEIGAGGDVGWKVRHAVGRVFMEVIKGEGPITKIVPF